MAGLRKPRAIMELEGNPGRRPLRNEPVPPSGRPQPPRWLSKDGQINFRHICSSLEAMHLLSSADEGAIAIASEALADVAACRKTGSSWHRPAELFHRFANSLGLTPVSRAHLVAKAPEPTLTEAERKLAEYGIKPLAVVAGQ